MSSIVGVQKEMQGQGWYMRLLKRNYQFYKSVTKELGSRNIRLL
jgi:hypothetical protein